MIEDLVFKGRSVQEALRKASNFFGVAEEDIVYDFVDEAPEQEVWIRLTKNPMMPRTQPIDPGRQRDMQRPMGGGERRGGQRGYDSNQGFNRGGHGQQNRGAGYPPAQQGGGYRGGNRGPQGGYDNQGYGNNAGYGNSQGYGDQGQQYNRGGGGRGRQQGGGAAGDRFNRRPQQGRGGQQRGGPQRRDMPRRDQGRPRHGRFENEQRPPRHDANWTRAEVDLTGMPELVLEAFKFVEETLQKMGMQLQVFPQLEADRTVFSIEGPDRPEVLAKKGETLIAIQYLVNKIFLSRQESASQIYVDSQGYRIARDAELREIAIAAADKVKRSNAEYTLSPMNPYERRQVHLTLKEDPAVATVSRGDGYIKRVSILPASMAPVREETLDDEQED